MKTMLEIGTKALNVDDVKSNILKRIERHQNDIVFWKKQLASANNVTGSESCIHNIKSLQERESELEMVLKYCF
jgi:hypothetical protein